MPVFLFPGQGSQRAGAAYQFHRKSDHARAVLDRAKSLLPGEVAAVMMDGDQETLNNTCNAQPALLCIEIAVAAHLRGMGIQSDVCAGHSLGEITAFTVAGALTLETAIPLVIERARLMSENVPEGGMAAVLGVPPDDIAPLLCGDTVIANYNGPAQTVISGSSQALAQSVAALKAAGVRRVLSLQVSGPFHSPCMRDAASQFADYLAGQPVATPHVPVLSSVSGEYEPDPHRIRALLSRQLFSPVVWTAVMGKIAGQKAVEAGPGSVLAGLAKRADCAPVVYAADTPEACAELAAVAWQ